MQAKTPLLGGFLFLVFVVSLYVLENSANLNQQKITNVGYNLNKTEKNILILHWNKASGKYIFTDPDFINCPKSNCQISTDRNDALKADAIMFFGMHPGMKFRLKKLKQLRLEAKNTTFIFHVREPPTLTSSLGNWSENFFDATMTYRRDSDIFNALYELVPKITMSSSTVKLRGRWRTPDFSHITKHSTKPTQLRQSPIEKFSHKYKMVTWLVSKCETPGGREKYVEELGKYVDVDIFGSCGLKPLLPRSDPKLDTYRKLLQPYFFYLSFENSRCRDYISEKFYNVLATQAAIPVVFGGSSRRDYDLVAPPHSFIHIEDFDDAQTLADYLHYLATNSTAYAEYFWWTKYYEVKETQRACATCQFLNDVKSGRVKTKLIKHFNDYWVKSANCNNPYSNLDQILKG